MAKLRAGLSRRRLVVAGLGVAILLAVVGLVATQLGSTTGAVRAPVDRDGSAPNKTSARPGPPPTGGVSYVTGVSADGRSFVDQYDQPILINGDSPWSMFSDLSPAQVELWAANRERHGFNAAIVSLIGSPGNGAEAFDGATHDNVVPFVDGDVTRWNEAYWARIDNYLTILRNHGITAFLYPVDGWTTLPHATFYHTSATDSYTFGRMVADRYPVSRYPNIVWMAGGDYQYYDDPAVAVVFQNVLEGIRSTGDNRMFSIQLNTESSSTDIDAYEPSVQWNFAYSYTEVYAQVLHGYRRPESSRDPRPSLLGESHYEGEIGDFGIEVLRRQQLWALTSGSPGEFTGSADWRFDSGWEARLDTPWATQAERIRSLFASLPGWQLLVPDDLTPLVTAGRGTQLEAGTVEGWQNDYVTAAQTPDRSLAVVYVPTNSGNADARTITLDLARLPAGYTAAWVDPTDATAPPQPASIDGSGQSTTPGPHSDGSRDWLLLIRS